MKIILLSDLHVTPKDKLTNYDFDVNAQFMQIVQYLKKEAFDLIIILGDVCYQEPDPVIYDWFFEEIKKLNKPFELISGNHDSSELLINKLNLKTDHSDNKLLFFEKKLENKLCLFLDTSEGVITGEQKIWLKNKLSANTEDLIIFMHHPPCVAGVPFMDTKYPLENCDEVLKLFQSQDYHIDVFTGHYHVDKDLQFDNCHIHICPSPYFILNQSTSEFMIEQQVPCFKILELDGNDIKFDSVYFK